jgi:Ricin-type beta-trefoil lectin domain-like
MLFLLVLVILRSPGPCFSQTNVLTYHNDNLRTGQNLTETALLPATVKSSSFGKLFTVPMDGKVDAQPLYVAAVAIPGVGVRPVVYAATEHDSVYAFDARTGTVYWQITLLGAGEVPSDSRSCNQVTPEIGITATPVIDLGVGPHGTIYLVAMSRDAAGNYHHRLHALDIATGAEEAGDPREITATYPGTGANSRNGQVIFDPKQYKSRPGLLLLNGTVYTGWSSHCDLGLYTGWVLGYDEPSLTQNSVFNFAPNGSGAALWASGGGMAADPVGNLFFSVANGTFDTTLTAQGFPSRGDYGNAFVKLTRSNGALQAADYWTMNNSVSESSRDEDLGSGGLTLLPDLTDAYGNTRHLGTGAGKDSNVYMFDRDNMGKFDPNNNTTLYQELPNGLGGGEFGSPAWFNGSVYYGAVGDVIRAFSVNVALLKASPASATSTVFGYPGTTPAISAKNSSNGILWAVENANSAVLHAYDATNLALELYNSNQAVNARDQFGSGNKFIVPTVADGRVFVGTTNSVAVFGGLPAPPSTTTVPAGWVNIISKSSGKCLDVQGGFQSDGAAVWQWTCWEGDNQKFWLTPVAGGYQITVKHSGLQMDVWGGPNATYDGAPLAQYPYWGSTNETFQVHPTADGYYTLNPVNSGKCLDVQGGFQSDGAAVWQWTCWGGDNQKWSFKPAQ